MPAQFAADSHILVITHTDEVALGLFQLSHEVGNLHFGLLVDTHLAVQFKPTGGTVDGEVERRGLQGSVTHLETFTLRPLYHTLAVHLS